MLHMFRTLVATTFSHRFVALVAFAAVFAVSSPAMAAPSIMFITKPAEATYTIGQTIEFGVMFDDDMTVTGTPQINFTIGSAAAKATYSHGSGHQDLYFRYVVQVGDLDTDGISLNSLTLNGGSIMASGVPADLSLAGLPDLTKVKVDGGSVVSVPSLTEWVMLFMVGMLALFGVAQLRRRHSLVG